MKRIFCCTLVMSFFLMTLIAQPKSISYSASWESLKSHQIPEWFRDAKFGIYFHWGIYSYMGMGEWYSHYMYNEGHAVHKHHKEVYGEDFQYHQFIPYFTASEFVAEDWAKLFKASGARFAGPVAEHCDNFSNWNSEVNPYNSMKMGPRRDIVGELSKAIKKEGLKFITSFHHSWEWGWYPTWSGRVDTTAVGFEKFYGERTLPETFDYFRQGVRESGYFTGDILPRYAPSESFVSLWKQKIYEVIDNYQPDFLWFDSRLFLIPEKDRQAMIAYYYNKESEWKKKVGMSYKNKDLPEGIAILDLERGRMNEKVEFPWLTDDSWAWNAWSWKHKMRLKNSDIVIDELVDIVSKNGCLLLNIIPTCDGRIPEEMRSGLLEIGQWLKVNGEAVYNTRPFITYGEGITKLKKNVFGGVQGDGVDYTAQDFRFTTNGDKLYITQLGMPAAGEKLLLHTFSKNGKVPDIKIKSLKLIGSKENIRWSQTSEGLVIYAPKVLPNTKALVYKAVYE